MCGSICMYVSESMFSAREFPTVHHCCPNTYLKKILHPVFPHFPTGFLFHSHCPFVPFPHAPSVYPLTLRFLSRERLLFFTLSSSFSFLSCSARTSKSLFLRRCLAACAMTRGPGLSCWVCAGASVCHRRMLRCFRYAAPQQPNKPAHPPLLVPSHTLLLSVSCSLSLPLSLVSAAGVVRQAEPQTV